MRAYTDFLNKTPSELLTEAESEIRAGLLMRERHITCYLRDFMEYLEESGVAPLTTKGRLTGVRSFYKYYNIDIPVLPKSRTKAKPQLKRREIPNKDDIRTALSICDPLERALILVGCASGLSADGISNLKVEEFLKGYDPETGITTLHLIREKVEYEHYTHLTPEASKAVLDYIEFRNRITEGSNPIRQEQLLKQKFQLNKKGEPTGYLFIGRYLPTEYIKLAESNNPKDRMKAEEIRKLKPKNIQKIYRDMSERAQKSSPLGEWNLIRSHGMRKFMFSTLIANGAPLFYVDYWVGHQVDATHDAYFRADPKALKAEYMKYIPMLTIEKPLNESVEKEYTNVIAENRRLTAEIERVSVERVELQDLRNEIDALYNELKNTGEAHKVGRLVHKIHPHRLILQPANDEGVEDVQDDL